MARVGRRGQGSGGCGSCDVFVFSIIFLLFSYFDVLLAAGMEGGGGESRGVTKYYTLLLILKSCCGRISEKKNKGALSQSVKGNDVSGFSFIR